MKEWPSKESNERSPTLGKKHNDAVKSVAPFKLVGKGKKTTRDIITKVTLPKSAGCGQGDAEGQYKRGDKKKQLIRR